MKKNKKCGSCNPRILQETLDEYLDNFNFIKKLTKRQRLIAWLIVAKDLNCKVTRFDAEWVGCHCWNTSVSEIERYDGIKIERQDTKRTTRFGETHCKEYWLSEDELEKAERHIKSLLIKEVA